jgi:glutaconate CoA-transferase subunit A
VVDKRATLDEAISLVRDGDSVALQGGSTQSAPMALVRALIRAGRRDLHAVCLSAGIPVDMLAAAGCISQCTFAAVGMEHFGLCQCFRRGVERGGITAWEVSETGVLAMLGAAARGLPFLPTRGMIGTDLLSIGNPSLRVIDDPFGGPPVVACAALHPDVALIHAHRADREGNVAMDPAPLLPGVTLMPRAARTVIVTVERIVDTDELRRTPERTVIPGFTVDAVVEVPFAAHPTSLFPAYSYDAAFMLAWVDAARDEASAHAFLEEWAVDCADQADYMARLGTDRLDSLVAEIGS